MTGRYLERLGVLIQFVFPCGPIRRYETFLIRLWGPCRFLQFYGESTTELGRTSSNGLDVLFIFICHLHYPLEIYLSQYLYFLLFLSLSLFLWLHFLYLSLIHFPELFLRCTVKWHSLKVLYWHPNASTFVAIHNLNYIINWVSLMAFQITFSYGLFYWPRVSEVISEWYQWI